MLKRTDPLSPREVTFPAGPPSLKNAPPRIKPRPREPLVTMTDDGDIPMAAPVKKPEKP
ncbi:MAG: hypothetical protein IPO41_14105 [Acidobacteria bacterium]|nr:hypothetical protein [Acidobacteriota bacterium]